MINLSISALQLVQKRSNFVVQYSTCKSLRYLWSSKVISKKQFQETTYELFLANHSSSAVLSLLRQLISGPTSAEHWRGILKQHVLFSILLQVVK
jgi:hypothetical protein